MTTCLGKSCSFGLPRVPFVNYCQFMYLVISLLVLRAGYGIWLYQFLIIAYRFILNVLNHKIRANSVGRLQVAGSDLNGSFLLFLLLLFSFIIVILNYCKVDYKVLIIRNNKLIYLSRMKSCLWGWSCHHYSLAQRPISHRIHIFLATLSIICKCGILGIGCLSIWCASGRGFLFRASATYRSL